MATNIISTGLDTASTLFNSIDGILISGDAVKGGYFTIDTIDNAPLWTKNLGTLCYCSNEKKLFQYNGTTWEEVKFGSGGGAAAVDFAMTAGSGNYSIVGNDTQYNQALGDYSTVLGYNSKAGTRGFKIISVGQINNKLTIQVQINSGDDEVSLLRDLQKEVDNKNNTGILRLKSYYENLQLEKVDRLNGKYFNLVCTTSVNLDEQDRGGLVLSPSGDNNTFRFGNKPLLGNIIIESNYNVAIGYEVIASGSLSHAEGYGAVAGGKYSHAEGKSTYANWGAHAEGEGTKALEFNSHAEGQGSIAAIREAHAEGRNTKALAQASHAEGWSTIAGNNTYKSFKVSSINTDTNEIIIQPDLYLQSNIADIYVDGDEQERKYLLDSGGWSQQSTGEWATRYADKTSIFSYTISSIPPTWSSLNLGIFLGREYELYAYASAEPISSSGQFGNIEPVLIDSNIGTNTAPTWRIYNLYENANFKAKFDNLIKGSVFCITIYIKDAKTNTGNGGAIWKSTAINGAPSIVMNINAEYNWDSFYQVGDYITLYYNDQMLDNLRITKIDKSKFGITVENLNLPTFPTTSLINSSQVYCKANPTIGNIIFAQAPHAEGKGTKATGFASHAEGHNTEAIGYVSHAGGLNTIAMGDNQTVTGKYNIRDTDNKYSHIIGNGTAQKRQNAFAIDWEGGITIWDEDGGDPVTLTHDILKDLIKLVSKS